MALAQFYDLAATEESDNHGDLINPYHQRAFYYHQANTTWYELDLAAFVKRYSDLNKDYLADQVTIRNRDQLFQATSDYGGINAMEQELYQLKVSLGSVPNFKPQPRDLLIEILFHKQQLAESQQLYNQAVTDRDSIVSPQPEKLRRAGLVFGREIGDMLADTTNTTKLIVLSNKNVAKAAARVERQQGYLTELWKKWSDYGFEVDFPDQNSLNPPVVITEADVTAAKARTEAARLKALTDSVKRPPTLNEALAANQVEAIPRELLDGLVQTWYHESTLDQLTTELDQFQDTVMELHHNRGDQIKIVAILAKYKDRFEQLLSRFDDNLGLDANDLFCQLDTDDFNDNDSDSEQPQYYPGLAMCGTFSNSDQPDDPESQLCALSDQE